MTNFFAMTQRTLVGAFGALLIGVACLSAAVAPAEAGLASAPQQVA